jgi:hypothetical protein
MDVPQEFALAGVAGFDALQMGDRSHRHGTFLRADCVAGLGDEQAAVWSRV